MLDTDPGTKPFQEPFLIGRLDDREDIVLGGLLTSCDASVQDRGKLWESVLVGCG